MALRCLSKPASSKVPEVDALLDERQAADRLGVSVYTLQRIRKRGEIGFTKIGNRYRYTAEAITAYLKSKSVKPCQTSGSKSVTFTFPSTKLSRLESHLV
jgi:excisionase family DNA binding protein